MELPVKILGLLLILSASTSVGFLKSLQLRLRYDKLSEIYLSLSGLKERIRLGGGDIERLIGESFEKKAVNIHNGEFRINENSLTSQDIALINEFFKNIGMSDSTAECERTEMYMSLLLGRRCAAEEKCRELGRIYNSLGFLFGIFICIFLL